MKGSVWEWEVEMCGEWVGVGSKCGGVCGEFVGV